MVLPQKEFMLLYKLTAYPGRIFTRQQLMDDIWGLDSETEPRTVDVHITGCATGSEIMTILKSLPYADWATRR